jgi:hypothetical protein
MDEERRRCDRRSAPAYLVHRLRQAPARCSRGSRSSVIRRLVEILWRDRVLDSFGDGWMVCPTSQESRRIKSAHNFVAFSVNNSTPSTRSKQGLQAASNRPKPASSSPASELRVGNRAGSKTSPARRVRACSVGLLRCADAERFRSVGCQGRLSHGQVVERARRSSGRCSS